MPAAVSMAPTKAPEVAPKKCTRGDLFGTAVGRQAGMGTGPTWIVAETPFATATSWSEDHVRFGCGTGSEPAPAVRLRVAK
jgi:hypothetical protein